MTHGELCELEQAIRSKIFHMRQMGHKRTYALEMAYVDLHRVVILKLQSEIGQPREMLSILPYKAA